MVNETLAEMEIVRNYSQKDKLIGELGMMTKIEAEFDQNGVKKDLTAGTRSFSGIAKTEVVLLVINMEAFRLLCYEKIKQANEEKTKFVFDSLLGLRNFFNQKQLHKDIQHSFLDYKNDIGVKAKFEIGNEIISEGGVCNTLYMIRKG